MSEDQNNIVTLKVRVTAEFREKIATTAKENNRSMNAEIVARLEESFRVKQGNYLNDDAVNDLLEAFTKKIFTALKSQEASRELMESTVNELKNKKAP